MLAKLYPNDYVFGEEVRKIVWQLRKDEKIAELGEWDIFNTTQEYEMNEIRRKHKNKQTNENN
jgi:hypothetical protein